MIQDTPWTPPFVSTTSATAASNAETIAGTIDSKFVTPLSLVSAVESRTASTIAALRNALAPRGGLAFDGTSGARAYATLTGQSIGTDAMSVSVMFKVPTSNPVAGQGIFYVGSVATVGDGGGSVQCYIHSNGKLQFVFRGASSADYRVTNSAANIVSAFGGKIVHLALVRSTTSGLLVWINGAALTLEDGGTNGTPPTWASSSITSTYFVLGVGNAASDVAVFPIYCASLYNLPLAQTDVTEIYELGGAVPERFKFGSQVTAISNVSRNSDFSAGATDWYGVSGATATVVSGALDCQTNATSSRVSLDCNLYYPRYGVAGQLGRRWRIEGTLSNYSVSGGAALQVVLGTNGTVAGAIYANGAFAFEFTNSNGPFLNGAEIQFRNTGPTGTCTFTLDNIVLRQIGAVAHYDADLDGIGYQLHDQSPLKLDAVVTTTGTSWTKQARRGYVRGTLTWAGTHEAKSLLGQRCLPDSAVMTLLTTKSTAATSGSGATCGTSSFPGYWWTGNRALTTIKTNQSITASIAYSNAAADNDIILDPDTANFTGSVAVEAHYTTTEGVY